MDLSDVNRRSGRVYVYAIAVGVGLLSLGLSLWQLTVPGYLEIYDSGVYFAAALHLVSGTMPYRNFTFVQPPGILLLMSPVALFSRIFGTHDGFIAARLASAIVTALNASLLALLIRHRGLIAMVISGAGLALLPVASFVSSGLRLEPYLIFFVLAGSLMVFPRHAGGNSSTLRLVLGGFLFGVAALVKLWAFFPFIALTICLVPRYRRRVFAFVGAAASGFVVFCLPFFLAAPRNFVSEVFVEQLARKANSSNDGGVLLRLKAMTGFSETSIAPTSKEVVILFAAILVVVAVAYSRRLRRETIDLYLLLAALISIAGLLLGHEFNDYYGYFTAPFLLGVIGISVGRLKELLRTRTSVNRAHPSLRRIGISLGTIVALALTVALVGEDSSFYSSYSYTSGPSSASLSAISNLIPAGSCVVYNYVGYGAVADRLQSTDPNCPKFVDPTGMWMAWGYNLILPSPTFVAQWKSYFETAQFVVLSAPYPADVAWNSGLMDWFSSNYYLLFGQRDVYIYAKKS